MNYTDYFKGILEYTEKEGRSQLPSSTDLRSFQLGFITSSIALLLETPEDASRWLADWKERINSIKGGNQ